MRESVPLRMRQRFSDIFEAQMREVKERYLEEMRRTSLRCVLRLAEDGSGDWMGVPDPPYKRLGRTENYEQFRRNRAIIARKYYLSSKLTRAILSKAHKRLPPLICDFRKYREKGYLDFVQ